MNQDHNPFAQSEEEPQKDDALDIMRLINKIAQSPPVPHRKHSLDKSPQSVFSASQGIVQSHHPRLLTDPNASLNSLKRENPVKGYSVIRKRVKLHSDYDDNDHDDSQFIDSLTNRKITDYFEKKHQSLPMPPQKQKIQALESPVIKRIKQKITLKKKTIENLKTKIDKQQQKLKRDQQNHHIIKQKKKERLIQFLSNQYDKKIYYSAFKSIRKGQNEREQFIKTKEVLKQKIEALKEGLKKNRAKGDEGISYLDQYTEQHQDYMKQWKKKVQDERKAVIKEIQRQPLATVFIPTEEVYYALPQFFVHQNKKERVVSENQYLPLYAMSRSENLRQGHSLQMKTFNLEDLMEEDLTILSYPKLMKLQRRMKLKNHLQKIFHISSKLNEGRGARLFLQITFFGHPPQSDMLLVARKCWQGIKPIVSLKQFLKHYDCLGEGIAKYVTKVILRAHQEARSKLGQEIVILPKNIIFDQRNDIRIENWLINETYRFQDFVETLISDCSYLYFPPEYQSQLCIDQVKSPGTWTIGVLLYQMIFGKKPFQFSHRMMDFEQFYVMNDLEFPQKPSLSEQGKDFLRKCLDKPGHRIDIIQALKHPYFEWKK